MCYSVNWLPGAEILAEPEWLSRAMVYEWGLEH
jgi:hypothetical protein